MVETAQPGRVRRGAALPYSVTEMARGLRKGRGANIASIPGVMKNRTFNGPIIVTRESATLHR